MRARGREGIVRGRPQTACQGGSEGYPAAIISSADRSRSPLISAGLICSPLLSAALTLSLSPPISDDHPAAIFSAAAFGGGGGAPPSPAWRCWAGGSAEPLAAAAGAEAGARLEGCSCCSAYLRVGVGEAEGHGTPRHGRQVAERWRGVPGTRGSLETGVRRIYLQQI